eukprot:CAMPEP_0113952698 /NCGR_PEP_ID=MMETSP1339-20121228/90569_1 /TAXON_ID=94617 /ORGANISM="Fibrocapsa japonica" /LENGTH=212 /DNA_ID=CAMNT_0000961355 /DNA_START=465 /DNA_END=1103 /DNA_ORIENTATION=- /assembly_acc=CAM_ASM_000762
MIWYQSNEKPVWETFTVALFMVGAQVCMLSSSIFHTFMCISEEAHDRLLRIDLAGIAALNAGCLIPGNYFIFYCNPVLQVGYIVASVCVMVGGVAVALMCPLTNKAKARRDAALACLVAFGIMPGTHWALLAPPSEMKDTFLTYLIMTFSWYGLGFFIWRTEIPECFFPGWFDIFLHSHQLWHTCVFIGAWCFYVGLMTLWDGVSAEICSVV